MLKLFLLRHGKATKFQADDTDYQRHLNKQGTAQINQIGYILRDRQCGIGQIISSQAYRTLETAEIINHYLALPKIEADDVYYLASREILLTKICKSARAKEVLFVGHNNGISDLAGYLTGTQLTMSTGQLIEITFELDEWSLVTSESGTQTWQVVPDVLAF